MTFLKPLWPLLAAFSLMASATAQAQEAPALPRIGGDFALTTHLGQAATQANFSDKPLVIFFGYTFCPDICPTTLAEMVGWVEELGQDKDKLHYVFVSVDAGRDDQETLAYYVDAFFDELVGLYGPQDRIDEIVRAYRVYAKKVVDPEEASDYTIDHTASVYLMDRDNRYAGMISFGESHDAAVAKLRKLIDEAT
ncbi:SCO family protein [Tropicimonas sp. TH_r6]|uniref:SCO family protein n=1 Tax=Tropicimonas sp. TH_r6 TaxID=3082085 RepID=UPI002954CDC4|nr:SCO family protein [Tropicimonas sp. TH_r6]MDV7143600.1 SCO family protein [Tropicimonas sp. TH_r6]